jgi:hypothetical protein
MRKHLLAAALAALSSTAIASHAFAGEAAATIRKIYEAYEKASANPDSRTPDILDPGLYSKRVGRLIAALKASCGKTEEVCGVDADFLIDGQDFEIKNVRVTETKTAAASATVEARFKNFGRQSKLTFSMVKEDGRWVIDRMKAAKIGDGGGYSLDEALAPR